MAGARLRLLITCFLFACCTSSTAAVPVRLPDCALMVFRHVEKTGGSTLRAYFEEAERAGEWEVYSPQGDPNDEGALPEFTNAARVRALLDFWQQVQAKANFTAHPRRLALEWHAESGGKPPWETALEVVSWLRLDAERAGCKVVVATLLRHPAEFYASFWRFQGVLFSKGQALEPWVAARPNLQSSILLTGTAMEHSSRPFHREFFRGPGLRTAAEWPHAFAVVPRDLPPLHAMLRKFDLLAPTDRFDEAMFVLSRLLSLPRVGIGARNIGKNNLRWEEVRANLTAVDLRRMDEYGAAWSPRNDGALASVVASSAPLDLALFDHACRSLKSALRRLSSADTAQLEAYLRSPAAVGLRAVATKRYRWLLRAAPLPGAIRSFERQDHGAARADASRRVWSLVPVE